jgi:hypothetical protein
MMVALMATIRVFPRPGCEDYFRQMGSREGEPPKDLTPAEWERLDGEHHITYRSP